jgi:uncharacterized protein YjbJ (UPF0337 family)
MNKDQLQGKWKQVKGYVQERWGELTNDEVDEVNGEFTTLAGYIQERYGIAREEAHDQINEWLREFDDDYETA